MKAAKQPKTRHVQIEDWGKVNGQNMHILTLQRQAVDASVRLVNMGITILKVDLEHSVPVIHIMSTGHTQKLDGVSVRDRITADRRVYEYQSLKFNCLIKWEKHNVH